MFKRLTALFRKAPEVLPIPSEDHAHGWKGLCCCCGCSVDRALYAGKFCWDAERPPADVLRRFTEGRLNG